MKQAKKSRKEKTEALEKKLIFDKKAIDQKKIIDEGQKLGVQLSKCHHFLTFDDSFDMNKYQNEEKNMAFELKK